MVRENKSWREQRKAVVMTYASTGCTVTFQSIWQAATYIEVNMRCKHETAKKEIRKALKTGVKRYGAAWRYNADGVGQV